MRITVTGGLGFIGSHFVEAAERAGHEVDILDACVYSGRTANLPYARRWNHCDIGDAVLVGHHLRRFNPQAVVNLAAETHVGRSIESRDDFLRTNIGGLNTLLEECHQFWTDNGRDPSFRVLNVSTDEVYGSLALEDAPWTESSPIRPNNHYAAAKAAGDHLAQAWWHTFDLPVITTHASNNYGSRQHPEKLIPAMVRCLLKAVPMTIHGQGSNIRDWLHVEDHCDGLLRALQMGEPGHVYNFGGGCERSNLAIASLLAEEARGRKIQMPLPLVTFIPDRPGNDLRYASNCETASTALGWTAGAPIEERIGDVVQWYIDNPNYAESYGR